MSHPPDHRDDGRWLRGLPAPAKNHFFYGMLLTDDVLRKDQRYFDGKRWLLNRLALGMGVLSGLDFELRAKADDSAPPDAGLTLGYVRLAPGVAIDGFGREIVVPAGEGKRVVPLAASPGHHHHAACADMGEFVAALGVTPANGAGEIKLLLQIAYDTEETDPQPVKAGHCADDCEPSTRREQFRLRVTRAGDERPRGDSTAVDQEATRADKAAWPAGGNLAGVFPQEPGEDVRHRGAAQAQGILSADAVPIDPRSTKDERDAAVEKLTWVTLGTVSLTVTWEENKATALTFATPGRYYRQLFGNDALSKLVFALADRVDEAARVRVLTFADVAGKSGNGQSANVYRPLPNALRVKVVDADGGAVKELGSVHVQFDVLTDEGGELFQDDTLRTPVTNAIAVNDQGQAAVWWKLGKRPGPHTVSARIVPANPADPPFHPGSQLAFHATATPTAPTLIGIEFDAPWCHDEKCRKYDWTDGGQLDVRFVFSRKVEQATALGNWFQAWAVYRFADGCVVAPQPLTFAEFTDGPVCPGTPADPEEVYWQAEGTLTGLHPHLCHGDAVRVVILGTVPANAALSDCPISGVMPLCDIETRHPCLWERAG